MSQVKPPVKPIDRILFSQIHNDYWFHQNPKNKGKGQPPISFGEVCKCKGFSDDRPYRVYLHVDTSDPKPFKVVFHWTDENYDSFTFTDTLYARGLRTEIDNDTYHMTDILEEHATKSAAQKAMRRFATESFAKVNDAPTKVGDVCHCVGVDNVVLRVGDVVEYDSCPGIIWRVRGERRVCASWNLQVEPVISFLVRDGTNKAKEISRYDVLCHVYPLDLVDVGSAYTKLANFMNDEARRRASEKGDL